jgi:hypothetical protein
VLLWRHLLQQQRQPLGVVVERRPASWRGVCVGGSRVTMVLRGALGPCHSSTSPQSSLTCGAHTLRVHSWCWWCWVLVLRLRAHARASTRVCRRGRAHACACVRVRAPPKRSPASHTLTVLTALMPQLRVLHCVQAALHLRCRWWRSACTALWQRVSRLTGSFGPKLAVGQSWQFLNEWGLCWPLTAEVCPHAVCEGRRSRGRAKRG